VSASVFDADRLVEEGAVYLLQIFGEFGRIDGEVEWCAQVHDGGFQDVSLWRRRILLRQGWTFKRRARGARRAAATIFLQGQHFDHGAKVAAFAAA
jgi:hypothetical protein